MLDGAAFEKCPALVYLVIAYSNLRSMPASLLAGNAMLTGITFINNQLESVPDGLFENQVALERLKLFGNKLSSLPPGLFKGP